MRGEDEASEGLFSYVSCSARVPKDHPLRAIRRLVDGALEALSGDFAKLYAKLGRPSIPPEKLLRALLLQAFYSVRSERQLIEQLEDAAGFVGRQRRVVEVSAQLFQCFGRLRRGQGLNLRQRHGRTIRRLRGIRLNLRPRARLRSADGRGH